MISSDDKASSSSRASGFWSYAHEDDALDDGAILRMAEVIAQEFELLSGKPLSLFVDREEIAWGQQWKACIDKALAQTVFFIPVITPRYFTRPECRRELLEFSAKAQALGVSDLLLPVLYVSPSELSASSLDEAISLIANTQYVDWRETRLLEPFSRDYRVAINSLAKRLMAIDEEVSKVQLNSELRRADVHDDFAGVADLMEQIAALLPDWLDAVLGSRVVNAQTDATWHETYDAVIRLKRSHAPSSAVFSAELRAGKEMLPLMQRHHDEAQTYVSRSVQLDALVEKVAFMAKGSPADRELTLPLRNAVDRAIENIRNNDSKPGGHEIRDHFVELRNRARLFRTLETITAQTRKLIVEGNAIVERWDKVLRFDTE